MRNKGYRAAALLFLVVALPALYLSHAAAPPAGAQTGTLFLELVPPPAPAPGGLQFGANGPAIPPSGSSWHELAPSFCTIHPQEAYGDNGDGVVSACDGIKFGGVVYHIDWAGPTYRLRAVTGADLYLEPTTPTHNPENPVCEIWEEIHPDFGTEHHIDVWEDANGTGVVDACDVIGSGGILYHVEDVSLNIRITPGGVPTERSTWGKVKSALWPF